MSALTTKQRRFIDVSIRETIELLAQYFYSLRKHKEDPQLLDNVSKVANALQSGIYIAGAISGPATLGVGTAVAAAFIVLVQTGKECYEWVKSYSEDTSEANYPDVIKDDIRRLSMFVELRQAAYLIAVRYRYVLDEILEETGVNEFAQYTAERMMKKMLLELAAHPDLMPDDDTLVDYLLSSVKLSGIHGAKKVTLKQASHQFGLLKSAVIPAKLLGARPEWIVDDGAGNYKFIASVKTGLFSRPTSTLRECGFIAVPRSKIDLESVAVAIKSHRELTDIEVPNKAALLQLCCFNHLVTRAEVEAYLIKIRSLGTQGGVQSLNDYLRETLQKHVIACCHDDRLRDLDLQGGNFSGVNFYKVNLEGCNLCNTDWTDEAILTKATFRGNLLNKNTNFHTACAELSEWFDITFHGNFCQTKMNGAVITNSTISPSEMLQLGSEWQFVKLVRVTIEDAPSSFQQDLETKLTQEHNARVQLQADIESVEKECAIHMHQAADAFHRQEVFNATLPLDLQHRLSELEQRQTQFLNRTDFRLTDLNNQTVLLRQVVEQHVEALLQLQQFRHRQDDLWNDQYAADTLRDQRLSIIEAVQSVFNRLKHYWNEELNTTQYQESKMTHIELYAASSLSGPEDKAILLTDGIDQFIELGKDVFVMEGEEGCGKTDTLNITFEERLRGYKNKTDWLPILLDMSQVHDVGRNTLLTALETKFTKPQIDTLIDENRCLIMFDNLDVSSISLQRLLDDCSSLHGKWSLPPKYIFSVKSSYLLRLGRDYRELFVANAKITLQFDSGCVIQPLNRMQIKRLLTIYHKEDMFRILTSDIRKMARSPLMLRIIIGVILAPSFKETLSPLRIDLYEAFWHALYEHVEPQLPAEYKDYANFKAVMQTLALGIFESGTDWVERPYEKKRHGKETKDPLSCLFQAKISYLSPLSMTKRDGTLRIKFMHPSHGYYLIAQQLIECLYDEDFPTADNLYDDVKNDKSLRLWNLRFLTDVPDILDFLVEFIHRDPDKATIMERLLLIVRVTQQANQRKYGTAASNAFTVRCRLDKNFDGMDLHGICIPNADATEVSLVDTNLADSILTNVCFVRGMLFRSSMQRSDLTGARFLNALSFIQTDGPLKVFAVYPSTTETIIAYVVEPENRFQKYKIAIISVEQGKVNRLKLWSAHHSDIRCMAWAVHNGMVRLASASVNGTTRVWSLNDTADTGIQIAQLNSLEQKPINVLAWGPDGNLLATGSDDNHVRIWNVNEKVRVFKSHRHASPVMALVWGDKNILISASDDIVIHLWHPSENGRQLEQMNLNTMLPVGQRIDAIHSLALSLNEKQLALGCINGDIVILNLSEKIDPILLRGHKKRVTSLVWMDHTLVSSSDDHTVRIWRSKTNVTILQHDHRVGKVDVLHNGRQLISGVDSFSSRFYFWSTTQQYGEPSTFDALGMISCIAAQPKGNQGEATLGYVATGFVNGAVLLYPLQGVGAAHLILEHEGASVQQLAWSRDGRYLASLGQDRVIQIKDTVDKPSLVKLIQSKPNTWFNYMTWLMSPTNDAWLVVGSSDGLVDIYDLSQLPQYSFGNKDVLTASNALRQAGPYAIQCLAAAPAVFDTMATCLALSVGDQIEIWSPVGRNRHPAQNVTAPSRSTSGSYGLLWGSSDREEDVEPLSQHNIDVPLKLDMLSLADKKSQYVGKNQPLYQFEHPNSTAIMLAWSPNGCYLASIDHQQSLYIWSTATFHCLQTYQYPSDTKCLIWSEQWLIVGTPDEMLVWNVTDTSNWDSPPKCIPIGGPLLSNDASNLVVAENKGIWVLNRDRLVSNSATESPWVKRVKPDLCVHQCNLLDIKGVSSSTKELLSQKGGNTSTTLIKYSLFNSWLGLSSVKAVSAASLPQPSTRAEIVKLYGTFPSTQSFQEDISDGCSSKDSPGR